jgi:hypothetical protein
VDGVAVRLASIIARNLVAEEFGVCEPGVFSGLVDDDRRLDGVEPGQLALWLQNDGSFTQVTSLPEKVDEGLSGVRRVK